MEQLSSSLKHRGLMLVLSSPSGAGKTSLTRALLEKDNNLDISISATTRPRRAGEVNGHDYQFIDVSAFNQMIENNELLEHAKVFNGYYYGTPKTPVEKSLSAGHDIIFDIDWQGTQQLAESARQDLVTIFVLPPSAEELERRLTSRARDTDEEINLRLSKAADEMSHFSEYDYVLVNSDFDKTLSDISTILNAERMKRHRQSGFSEFVRQMKSNL